MYPIRFKPISKKYIWGSELWHLVDRDGSQSEAENGVFQGKTLHAIVEAEGEKLLGLGREFERFPLLLKVIDAKLPLSIQVHPNEETTEELGGDPKTEMWVAMKPSSVYAGLKKGASKDEFLGGLKKHNPADFLERIEMRKGEVVFIPGGRIHAICEGALLFEVQQNSETTYRIYDWNRTDANGKQRDLHVEQALKAIYWQDSHDLKITARHLESDLRHQFVSLGACPFFAIDRFDVFNEWRISASPRTFQIFFCLEGEAKMHGEFETEDLKVGMTYLIPAGCSPVEIKGKCQILRIRLP